MMPYYVVYVFVLFAFYWVLNSMLFINGVPYVAFACCCSCASSPRWLISLSCSRVVAGAWSYICVFDPRCLQLSWRACSLRVVGSGRRFGLVAAVDCVLGLGARLRWCCRYSVGLGAGH